MTNEKQNALAFIDTKKDLVRDVADKIWGYAELSLEETKSAALYCETLEQEGFTVERGVCGIPTAFAASYGAGAPHIGILAEYDALSGLSQRGGATRHEPLQEGGAGHGCGHNLLGAGALAAALGVKHWLEATGHSGAVTLYGCPGEEGGAAKAFMARDGLWKRLDAALAWHPDDCSEVVTGSCNATIQVQYTFRGVASHAADAPERGRSALDAVELMNVGVQFLREHMPAHARIHYAVTDTGGRSPNVVQALARALYMVRGASVAEALALQARVDKIADGAALMTETTCERRFIDGTSNTVPNRALEEVVYRNFAALGVPSYTAEERAYAAALRASYTDEGGEAMHAALLPRREGAFNAGSTDVGDVSWLTPTVQAHVAAFPRGCPGHSWQNVSCGATEIGRKAALHAGKLLCASAIDLFSDPMLLAAARAEFERRTAEGYVCPIPPDAAPVVAE